MLLLLLGLRRRGLFSLSLLPFLFLLGWWALIVYPGCPGAILGDGFGSAMVEVGLDFFHLPLHAVVHLLDEHFLLLVLPVEGVGLVLVVQVVDAAVGLHVRSYLVGLAIVDLFDLAQVAHVHFVAHFVVDDLGGCGGVDH